MADRYRFRLNRSAPAPVRDLRKISAIRTGRHEKPASGRGAAGLQDLRPAEDRGERRTEFVRQHGEELVLAPVGLQQRPRLPRVERVPRRGGLRPEPSGVEQMVGGVDAPDRRGQDPPRLFQRGEGTNRNVRMVVDRCSRLLATRPASRRPDLSTASIATPYARRSAMPSLGTRHDAPGRGAG